MAKKVPNFSKYIQSALASPSLLIHNILSERCYRTVLFLEFSGVRIGPFYVPVRPPSTMMQLYFEYDVTSGSMDTDSVVWNKDPCVA